MKRGDIIEFRRTGPVATILGGLLKWFEPAYDGWGWHLAIAYQRILGGWVVLEAVSDGVSFQDYTNRYLEQNTRSWRWLDEPPTLGQFNEFANGHLGKAYDVTIYFWTALQYLVRHYWNHKIPRLLDERFTCWELVFEFCEEMGKPLGSRYDCPLISDFHKAVQGGR